MKNSYSFLIILFVGLFSSAMSQTPKQKLEIQDTVRKLDLAHMQVLFARVK